MNTVAFFLVIWCSPEVAVSQEQPYPDVEILWEVRLGNGTSEIWKESIRGVSSEGGGVILVSSVYRPPGTLIWRWKSWFVEQQPLFSTVSDINPRTYFMQNRSRLERAVVHYENQGFSPCVPDEMKAGDLMVAGSSLDSHAWRDSCAIDSPSGLLYFWGAGVTKEIWVVGPGEEICSVVTEHWLSNNNPIIPGARRVHLQCMGTGGEAFMIPIDIRINP